ncbi:MAG: hypothetical protein JJU05_14745 [Verrucomicrobia bacterium]|nr:hypothetical protein [Verrucomicrobiota bacterium]MCH8528037.1 hypothetical protein [Kiritimatiellia bacterium]
MMIYSLAGATLQAPPNKPKVEMTVGESGKSAVPNRFRPLHMSVAPSQPLSGTAEISATNSTYDFSTSQKTEWTRQDERQFLDLSRKFALDSITAEERRKLECLERMRYSLNSNRSYREILAEKRHFEKADKLIHALNEYLETTH